MSDDRPDVVATPSGVDGGHRAPRDRPRLRDLLVLVAICAGVLALWRRVGPESIIPVASILAFGVARRRGGRGVLATAFTAAAALFSFFMGFYAWGAIHLGPNRVDYLGPVLSTVIVAAFSQIYGASAGGLAWLLALGLDQDARLRLDLDEERGRSRGDG